MHLHCRRPLYDEVHPFTWRNLRVSLKPHFRSAFMLPTFSRFCDRLQNFHFLLFNGGTSRVVLVASPLTHYPGILPSFKTPILVEISFRSPSGITLPPNSYSNMYPTSSVLGFASWQPISPIRIPGLDRSSAPRRYVSLPSVLFQERRDGSSLHLRESDIYIQSL